MEDILMNNFELFKSTIETLSQSQGYYNRLYNALNQLSNQELDNLKNNLPKFNDTIDVIMYLEQ